jgi:glutaredoxin
MYAILGTACAQAQDYILFYGNGCPHCKKVEDFFDKNKVTEKFDIVQKEVFYNKKNLTEMQGYMAKHDLDYQKIGVPFLIINSGADCQYINGDQNIIKHFQEKIDQAGS